MIKSQFKGQHLKKNLNHVLLFPWFKMDLLFLVSCSQYMYVFIYSQNVNHRHVRTYSNIFKSLSTGECLWQPHKPTDDIPSCMRCILWQLYFQLIVILWRLQTRLR